MDTAHQLVELYLDAGDTSELRSLIHQLVATRDVEVPEELSPDTYREIHHLAGDLLRVG